MERKTTLAIVDDDKIFQLITLKTLRTLEHVGNIWQFYDGEEALEYIQQHLDEPDALPDMILLDINMPVTDGWTFLNDYKELQSKVSKSITIHMVSSSIDPKDIERAGKSPLVKEYIMKPIAKEKIQAIIQEQRG